MNIAEIEIQLSELVKQPFDPGEFALRLLEIYNAPKAALTKLPNETLEDAVAAYRSAFRAALDRDGRMCLCGVLGAEAGALSPEVAEEAQSFFRCCIDDLTRRVGGPGAEARAFHVIATLEGGMMLARVYQSIQAFDQAATSLASRY